VGLKPRPKKYYVDVDVLKYHVVLESGEDSDYVYRWRGVDSYVYQGVTARLREMPDDWPDSYLEGPDILLANVGDTVYVVVEDYGSGSTFGRTEHDYSVEGVFATGKEAAEFVEVSTKNNDYFGGHNRWIIESVVVMK